MTEPNYAYQAKPRGPDLRNVPIGRTIRLIGDPKPHTILSKDAHYAHFGNDDKASLCCPVSEECMHFGDGSGWMLK